MKIKIILASASPRRKTLLGKLITNFEVSPVNIDESAIGDEGALEHTRRLAETKARKGAETLKEGLVIGADTVVTLDGVIFGKPADEAEAMRMLKSLSGRTHTVITAFCVLNAGTGTNRHPGEKEARAVRSRVTIKKLTTGEIDAYIATGESMDKAGAYAVQGLGGKLVEKVDGSYTNVVGLPMEELEETLREMGAAI